MSGGPQLGAVLFDMDGLLVDTEGTWYEVMSQIMTGLGASWGPEHQADLLGGSLVRSATYMARHAGTDVAPATIGQWMLDGMAERLAEGVDAQPGALELVDEVARAGVPRALVSSSQRVIVDAVLAALKPGLFDFTLSGDDVTHLKPHPEPYLTAVARLGLTPVEVVVLEDSPTGVASAQAAGCPVVMVPSVVVLEPAPGRTVLTSLKETSLSHLRAIVAESGRSS